MIKDIGEWNLFTNNQSFIQAGVFIDAKKQGNCCDQQT
jgi:hypothetical protein